MLIIIIIDNAIPRKMKYRDWKSSTLVVWIYNLPTFRGFASQDWQYCKSKPLKVKISNLCISFYEESYSVTASYSTADSQ